EGRVLVVDDERGLREMLRVLLGRAGLDVTVAESVKASLARLQEAPKPYDAVVTDLLMPDGSGMDVLRGARSRSPETQVVLITAYAATERAVEAMRDGAYDFLEKPFKNDVLLATLEKALEKRRLLGENRQLRSRATRPLIGVSPAMDDLRRLIGRAAKAPSSVLVTGESGTGKELVARALHDESPRWEKPFVVVNCGALPEALMESELFGHARGAFTGAGGAKEGLFRAADGGTLFLDEVGELPLALQVKLLRVLQERKVRPVGGERERPVDVRVVAATNRDLEAEVSERRFREDLFYRLNVIRLELPALRERPEDITPLAAHLLAKHASLQGRGAMRFSEEAVASLAARQFPGNVRELENVVERAVALSEGLEIGTEDLRMRPGKTDEAAPLADAGALPEGFDLDDHLAGVERRILHRALAQTDGNRTQAARLLGMSFRSFRYRLAKHED
ncbi:MAG: sigma-54 dependent transcriptional regulator, partial [Myxococcota bacterium]